MRALMIAVALVLAGSAGAYAQLTDNFDSYADQAAFNAVWTPGTTAPVTLLINNADPAPQSAPNLVYQGTTLMRSRREVPGNIQFRNIDFKFDFHDETGTGSLARAFNSVYGYSGGWGVGLQNLIQIGKYNGTATTKYNCRLLYGTPSGWFTMDDGPDRSVGWHTARIVGDGAVEPTIKFYIDGVLGKTCTLTQSQGDVVMNWAVVGSEVTSTHGMATDNLSVTSAAAPVTPPTLSDAKSVRMHDVTNYNVDLWEASNDTGNTEGRQGGPTSVVVQFDKNVQRVTNTLADVLMVNGTVDAIAVAGDTVTVTVSGVVNGVLSTMTFPGIATAGSPAQVSTDTLCIRPLVGDADNNGAVNIFDLIQIRNNLNQPVTSDNFRNDVTADDLINIFDLIATRNALNVTVPGCP